jgi:uncharacterized protein
MLTRAFQALAFAAAMSAPGAARAATAQLDCHIGLYRLANGTEVDIGAGQGEHLRWRLKDGVTGELTRQRDGTWTSTYGWTKRSDGKRIAFGACPAGDIRFDGVRGTRVAFDTTEVRFKSGDATLAGRLVLPRGIGRVPIVVLVHGSEHDSALDFFALQRLFPSEGIGAFVYDKRGTGASGGDYTQDYLVLADDAIAAKREALRLAGARAGRVGYQAGSQGGWVAPLAARIERVDFVIVGFGLAISPLEEDREAIAFDMQRQAFGPDVMKKAMEVADASAAILTSNFQDGYARLDELKRRYGGEPWFRYVRGDVTSALLSQPAAVLRSEGPKLFAGIPLHYDPMPVLENLEVPQLWILGGDDLDAPSGETSRRLRTLQAEAKPITLALFPRAGHGIYLSEPAANGEQVSTRQPEGYFAMMRDFIVRGRIGRSYGDSVLYRHR